MENRKDIGKAFKDKLENLEKYPNDDLWNSIEKDLNKIKKRRLFFWIFPALFAVGLTTSILFYNQKQNIGSRDKKVEFNSNVKSTNSIVITTDKKVNKSNNEIDNTKEELNDKSVTKKTRTTNNEKNNKITSLKEIQEPILKGEKQNKNKSNSNQSKIRKIETKRLVSQTKKTIVYNDLYEEYEVVKKYKITVKKTKITDLKNSIHNKKSQYRITKKISPKKFTGNKHIKKTNNPKLQFQKQKVTKYLDSLSKDQKQTLNNEFIGNGNPSIIKNDTLQNEKVIISKLIKKLKPKSNLEKDSINTEDVTEIEYNGSVFYGPTFFGSFSNRSMINTSLDNASRKHPITSYYGFYLKSKFNRFGISIGFSKINLKISNQFEQIQKITDYTNIDFTNSYTKNQIDNYFNTSNNLELIQKISYFEMTMNFYYSIFKKDKGLGAEVFTGFSLMELDENKLFLSSNQFKNIEFGSVHDLNKINISLNIGFAISYKLSNHYSIDANPILKYYLSPFSENNIKPISFSVQTGFTYKF